MIQMYILSKKKDKIKFVAIYCIFHNPFVDLKNSKKQLDQG